jgi:hypothetical protein
MYTFCTLPEFRLAKIGFPMSGNVLTKSEYKVRTNGISRPAYKSIGFEKLYLRFVSAEFIAPAVYDFIR